MIENNIICDKCGRIIKEKVDRGRRILLGEIYFFDLCKDCNRKFKRFMKDEKQNSEDLKKC